MSLSKRNAKFYTSTTTLKEVTCSRQNATAVKLNERKSKITEKA